MHDAKHMAPPNLQGTSSESANLDVLLDYTKYLYENELNRTDNLNATSKTYIVFISSTFTVLVAGLTWVGIDYLAKQAELIYSSRYLSIFAMFWISVLILVLSFVFVVLSVKIRSFERLCDPLEFMKDSEAQNIDLIKKDMAANYAVATSRNFDVNNRKSRWLFRALFAYLAALVLFLLFAASIFVALVS